MIHDMFASDYVHYSYHCISVPAFSIPHFLTFTEQYSVNSHIYIVGKKGKEAAPSGKRARRATAVVTEGVGDT